MKTKSFILILTVFTLACSTFHSRMFIKEKPVAPVNGLVINPTIVAYQNTVSRYKNFDIDNEYWIELSVADSLTAFPEELLDLKSDHRELAGVRNQFRERVMKSFTVDTIVVRMLPTEEEIHLAAVQDIPGWKWELKYRFGSIPIPTEIDSMLLIIPYQKFDQATNQLKRDTIEFSMIRYESHLKDVWAPDVPGSYEEYQAELAKEKAKEESKKKSKK